MRQSDIFSRERDTEDALGLPPWWAVRPSAARLVGAVLLAAVAAAAVWTFTGTVTRSAEISGIVFPQYGIKSVKSQREGAISSLQVKVGETVEAGDLIAVIPDTQLLEEIEAARAGGASQQELEALYDQYQAGSMVYAPIAGQVVELAEGGAHIDAAETVAGITSSDPYTNEAEIRAYVSADTAQSISKGMEVRIRPKYNAKKRYGYLPGLVSSISDHPVTEADISRDLGRFCSGIEIPKDGDIVEVRVTLLLGADEGQAAWDGAGGAALALDVSTLCSMEVIIAEQTPWEWLTS